MLAQLILVYADPIWAGSLKHEYHRNILVQIERRILMKISGAYRTATTEALEVVAGIIPIDLVAKEIILIYNKKMTKKDAREHIIDEWQKRWTRSRKDRHKTYPVLAG